jgi:hypothetical protein
VAGHQETIACQGIVNAGREKERLQEGRTSDFIVASLELNSRESPDFKIGGSLIFCSPLFLCEKPLVQAAVLLKSCPVGSFDRASSYRLARSREEDKGMKRVFLLAIASTLMFAHTACAKSLGLLIVTVEPVRISNEIVRTLSSASSSKFPDCEILPLSGEGLLQGQNSISQVTAEKQWDYGAVVRLEMTKVVGTVAFFNRKTAVTAYAHIEIATKDGSFFDGRFEGKAVGDSAPPNLGSIYLKALNKALETFGETFKQGG